LSGVKLASGRMRRSPLYDPGVDASTADFLRSIAEEARSRIRASDDASVLDEVEENYSAMFEAMDWYLEHAQADEAYRFASALVPFWMATKRLDEGARWFADALRHPAGTDARRARALYDHGYLVFWAGRYDLAAEHFADARALAEAVADHDLVALALAGSARVALNDDLPEAIRLLRGALDVTAAMPDSIGRSSAMHVLGVALQLSGDLAGARKVMRKRLELGRARGEDSIVYIESTNLSMVERKLGNLDHAEALSRDALRIVASKRNELAIPWVINGLAAVTAAKGEHERAATLIGIAEGLMERAGGEWPADERKQYEGTLAALATGLASAMVDRRRANGGAMTLDEGVAYALSEKAR
jgi:tetratricopeptide (TPR) repeat protein